jgi:hypothetical protein
LLVAERQPLTTAWPLRSRNFKFMQKGSVTLARWAAARSRKITAVGILVEDFAQDFF